MIQVNPFINKLGNLDENLVSCCLVLSNESQAQELAQVLTQVLTVPLFITLSGQLGAGKTTLVRALLRAYGYEQAIKSPTYTIVESYPLEKFSLHHFDWYRLDQEDELEFLGFRDYLGSDAINIVEWPQKAPSYAKQQDIEITIDIEDEKRIICFTSHTVAGDLCVQKLKQKFGQ